MIDREMTYSLDMMHYFRQRIVKTRIIVGLSSYHSQFSLQNIKLIQFAIDKVNWVCTVRSSLL